MNYEKHGEGRSPAFMAQTPIIMKRSVNQRWIDSVGSKATSILKLCGKLVSNLKADHTLAQSLRAVACNRV